MDAEWKCPVADAEIVRLAGDIDRLGYGILRNYVSPAELEAARAVAVGAVAAAGGEYACFTGADALAGTVLGELPKSPAFKSLCRRLYELATGRPGPEVKFYQIFRCLQGATGQVNSYRFHYDSYVLTALLPVAIPETGARGDLLLVPARRPIRRSYMVNVCDKILVDNGLAQLRFRRAARRGPPETVAIGMTPGDMCFFWGYRTIHTNAPCDPDKLRATALFHYGDPHQDSPTRALIRRTRRMLGPFSGTG